MARLPPATERVVLAGSPAKSNQSPAGTRSTRSGSMAPKLSGVQGFGEITSLAHADGYFEIPSDVESVAERCRGHAVLLTAWVSLAPGPALTWTLKC